MIIRPYIDSDEDQVVALWHTCGLVVPQNDPLRDIKSKIAVQPELFLVGLLDDSFVATVMAGYEGHRGWLNYLAVSPEHQRQGYGRKIVQAAEETLANLGCPKINLQVRTSNKDVIEFYRRIGYTVDDVISMGKRL